MDPSDDVYVWADSFPPLEGLQDSLQDCLGMNIDSVMQWEPPLDETALSFVLKPIAPAVEGEPTPLPCDADDLPSELHELVAGQFTYGSMAQSDSYDANHCDLGEYLMAPVTNWIQPASVVEDGEAGVVVVEVSSVEQSGVEVQPSSVEPSAEGSTASGSQADVKAPPRRRKGYVHKPKMYELADPLPDLEMEKKRRNAMKARNNRLKNSSKTEELKNKNLVLQKELNTLRELNASQEKRIAELEIKGKVDKARVNDVLAELQVLYGKVSGLV